MSAPILDRIRNADELPSLPTVAVEVIRLTRDENGSIDELLRIIESDPALTAKLLRVVNSAYFGMPRKVTSLRQAMGLLGWRAVRVMVLSFSLVDLQKQGDKSGFSFSDFWRKSLTTAVVSRMLARSKGSSMTEEVFVAGLLAGIGRLASIWSASELYEPVLQAMKKQALPIHDVELQVLGVTHAAIGRELLTFWELPEEIAAAVGAHLGEGLEELEGAALDIVCSVSSGAAIASVFCNELPESELNSVKALCVARTGVKGEALERILENLNEQVVEMAELLSLQIGQTIDYADIQSKAASQLARLTMQAEVERMAATKSESAYREQAERLQRENSELQVSASTDRLTGLANRAAFDESLEAEIVRSMGLNSPLALLMIDLDHFKQLNDLHGHLAGDLALRALGHLLERLTNGDGLAARFGGEEFAVILPEIGPRAARAKAEEIRAGVQASPIRHKDATLTVTASVGGIWLPVITPDTTALALIDLADMLLYEAKRQGRNRIEFSASASTVAGKTIARSA